MSLIRLAGALLVAVGVSAAAEEPRAERFDLRSLSAEELIAQLKANDDRFDRLRISCDRTTYSRPLEGHWKRAVHAELNGDDPPPAPDPDRIDTSLRRYTWAIKGGDVAAEHYALEPRIYNPINRWKLVGARFDEVFGCHDNGFSQPLVWEHRTDTWDHSRSVAGDTGSVADLKHALGIGFGHMIVAVQSWTPLEEAGVLVAVISKWPERTGLLTATLSPELIAREMTVQLEVWNAHVTTSGVSSGPGGLRVAQNATFHGRYNTSKRIGDRWDLTVRSIDADSEGELWETIADHSTPISFPRPRE